MMMIFIIVVQVNNHAQDSQKTSP
jgi:hypothetical protein